MQMMYKLLLSDGKYWKGGDLSKSTRVGKTWSSKQAFTLALLHIMEDFNPIASSDNSQLKNPVFLEGPTYDNYHPMLKDLRFIRQTSLTVEEFVPGYHRKYDLIYYILDYLNEKNNKFRTRKDLHLTSGLYLCERCGMITDDPSLFKNKVVCKKCKEELENDSAG